MVYASSNNVRIAKNAVFLYIRMIILMGVTLYTSRVILQSLGIEDYGIYNVVGGVIAMFGFLSGSLSTASQRYITFELGKGENGNPNKVFSTCVILHAIIALLIAMVAEPAGIWFICNKLMIPNERFYAAMWVYQFSIISMIIMFISVPFNALIVAHERMGAFAYISIVDALLRLGVAYLIAIDFSLDRLILYGALILLVQIINRFCYTVYCNMNFKESHVKYKTDKPLMKEMGAFASWSIFGNIAFVTYTQGINLLLGTFFLPAVNAARGIAVQVQGAVNQVVQNFQTAINPQITKNYAAGAMQEMVSLVFRSSRFSFYLVMMMTIPLFTETETILKLWLDIVPDYTVVFLRIILLTTWLNSIANPLIASVKATGNVRKYESIVGGMMIAILPISYVFLRLGFTPVVVFVVHLCIESLAMICRILIAKDLIGFSLRKYTRDVVLSVFSVGTIAFVVPVILHVMMKDSITRSLVVCTLSILWSCVTAFVLGLTKNERNFFISKLRIPKR